MVPQMETINDFVTFEPHGVVRIGKLKRGLRSTQMCQIAHVVVCRPNLWEIQFRNVLKKEEYPNDNKETGEL